MLLNAVNVIVLKYNNMKHTASEYYAQVLFIIILLLWCLSSNAQTFNTYSVCNISEHTSEFISDITEIELDENIVSLENGTYSFTDIIDSTSVISNSKIEYYTKSDVFIKIGMQNMIYQIKWITKDNNIITFFNVNTKNE